MDVEVLFGSDGLFAVRPKPKMQGMDLAVGMDVVVEGAERLWLLIDKRLHSITECTVTFNDIDDHHLLELTARSMRLSTLIPSCQI